MNEDKDFSLGDSEELINNLKTNAAPELEKLRSTLNLLSHVHDLSPTSSPPVLPSEIGQPVQLLTRRTSHTRRSVITSILSIGILASASLAAAAVTGRGPAPIVNAGHQSAKLVKAVAGAISDAVTGKRDQSPAEPSPAISNPTLAPSEDDEGDVRSEDSEDSLIGPSSLPTSGGDDEATKSNSEDSDDEGISLSVTASPEPRTIKPSGIPKPTSSPEDDSSDDEDEADDD